MFQTFQGVFGRSPASYVTVLSILIGLVGGGVIVVAGWQYLAAVQSTQIEVLSESPTEEPLTETEEPILIYVDINGAVVHPGLYHFTAEARVADVVTAAGGFSDQADADYIAREVNLSAKVQDSQKIYIPFLSERDSTTSSATSKVTATEAQSETISINTATLTQLQTLNGVGEVRATAIIQQRPYRTIDELVEKKVLPQSVVEKNRDLLRL